ITMRAEVVATPKALRDTYASTLFTYGVSVPYVARQLGHSTVVTTLAHYAKYITDDYVVPEPLSLSELPADILARTFDQKMTRSGGTGNRAVYERSTIIRG
ncbi:MAG: hypothetical protein V3T14_09295, partial [Myxococcota bacterium]